MKKLIALVMVLMALLVVSPSASAWDAASGFSEVFTTHIYPWYFYAPEDASPTINFVLWGYYDSPKNGVARTTASYRFEFPKRDSDDPEGMKPIMVRQLANNELQNYEIKWIKPGNLWTFIKSGGNITPWQQNPKDKLGVSIEFKFVRGDKTYSTTIDIPCTGGILSFDDENGQLRSTIRGLVFGLTEKEMKSRKVYNILTKTYVNTGDWKVNGTVIK
ncbi:MAG: hypothetical protein HQM10_09135 [Candidatus Riflebacteria bacterium]|nr:hypothetical protein [Candidatus Riflebacteria bacterium]